MAKKKEEVLWKKRRQEDCVNCAIISLTLLFYRKYFVVIIELTILLNEWLRINFFY